MATWLIWLLSLGAGAGAAVVLLWALFWDRARGRRRCPACFYDMSGAPDGRGAFPLTCPECGRRARTARALRRTRRRWRIAACAAVIAAVSFAAPLALTGSWLRFVPAPALDLVIGTFFEDEAAAAVAAPGSVTATGRATLASEWDRYLACWQVGRVALEEAVAAADQPPPSSLGFVARSSSTIILHRNSEHHALRLAIPGLAEAACVPGRSYERTYACSVLAEMGPRASAASHRIRARLKVETEKWHAATLLDTLMRISDRSSDTQWLLQLHSSGLPRFTRQLVLCRAGGADASSWADPWFMADVDVMLHDLLKHDDPRLRCAVAQELQHADRRLLSAIAALEQALPIENHAPARRAMQHALETLRRRRRLLGRGRSPGRKQRRATATRTSIMPAL